MVVCSTHRKVHCSSWSSSLRCKMINKLKWCVGWGNQTQTMLPRWEGPLYPPLHLFWIAKPSSPLETAATVVLQPPSALVWIMRFIYQLLDIRRSLCSCHGKIHQSDVIPLLPQQCNSPALYWADGPSHIILLMVVGQFNRKREVWRRISNKGTMTS